jgi:hypothetical protein
MKCGFKKKMVSQVLPTCTIFHCLHRFQLSFQLSHGILDSQNDIVLRGLTCPRTIWENSGYPLNTWDFKTCLSDTEKLRLVGHSKKRVYTWPQWPCHLLPFGKGLKSNGHLPLGRMNPRGSGIMWNLPVGLWELEELCLTSPPRPTKASLKQSVKFPTVESWAELLKQSSGISLLSASTIQPSSAPHSLHLGSFPHLSCQSVSQTP